MPHANVMLALVLDSFGAPMRLQTIERPTPTATQVLVRIVASGVNPLDAKIPDGSAAQAKVQLPAILGMDMAGVVESVGRAVTRFKPGDEVFGMTGGVGAAPGTLAQFAAVDADLLALKPPRLSMREAAVLPMAFITAWEGLLDRAGLSVGQKLLVTGGAGGVGQFAVQIGCALGARVVATDAAHRLGAITELGANAVDHATTTMADSVAEHTGGQGFDVIYDTVGGNTLDEAFSAVRPYGHVVSCTGWGAHKLAPLSLRSASYSGVFTLLPLLSGQGRHRHGEILAEAARLAQAGQLRPRLDPRRFTLDSVAQAHALMGGQASGKVVIDVS